MSSLTDRAWIGVLLAALCGSSVQAAYPTAVFTLDTQHEILFNAFATPLDKQFTQWAESCHIVAGGALYVLRCPPAVADVRSFEGDEPPEAVDVTLALFRDLDETIYLAGCLTLEELAEMSKGSMKNRDERKRPHSPLAEPIGTYDEPPKTTTAPPIGPVPPVENELPHTSAALVSSIHEQPSAAF